MRRRRLELSVVLGEIVAIFLGSIVIVPVALILVNSVKSIPESHAMSMALPEAFRWENYLVVIEKGRLVRSFFNSIFYAAVAICVGIVASSLAAFVIARNKSRVNRAVYYVIIIGISLPINYVALMKVMQLTHLVNSRLGISLLYTALQIPFSVFLISGFVSTIPRELDESAVIEGCGGFGLFSRIVLPLMKPVTITVMILNFMGAWNNFILPLYYLNSSRKWPMTLAVFNFFGQYEQEWNYVCADIVLTSLPVFIIYLLGQRYIISGMTSGAVKA